MKTEKLYLPVPYLKALGDSSEEIKKILYFVEIKDGAEPIDNVVAVGVEGDNGWRSWGNQFDYAIAHLLLTGVIPNQYEKLLKERKTPYLLPFVVNDNHD